MRIPPLHDVEVGDAYATQLVGVSVVILYLFEDGSDYPLLGVVQGDRVEWEDRWSLKGKPQRSHPDGYSLVRRIKRYDEAA